ncbi:spermidine synthase [Kitasatospora kifunensis]|uniref:Spermidine synthase n=1 Tax=Kitasatospora kifunensis TaxID=58351 RepID=A0A7W7QXI1_KITKI|nr:spermidine synthase [Kitasatospora kifunensis]MBB4921485.1 spermidine synthase [Kitasatospora kifunensis]
MSLLPKAPDVSEPPHRDSRQPAITLDRRDGPYGEVVLRRRGADLEIIANGCFLMDTADGRSERLLIQAALDELTAGHSTAGHGTADQPSPAELSVLIGGLGVGFSLAYAAAEPRWQRIAVVEREEAIIGWHRTGPLAAFSAGALDDPRVEILHTDLLDYLGGPGTNSYDALCLDIDNGPDWTVTDSNSGLYQSSGLAALQRRLNPGGVLAVWSAQPSTAFEQALRAAGFTDVHTLEVAVARGVPDVVHLARRA